MTREEQRILREREKTLEKNLKKTCKETGKRRGWKTVSGEQYQVRDSFLPANNGSFYLKVSGDHLTVCDRAPADVTLYTDIADLSSLVMGATPLKDFLAYGQMSISDKSFADDVQKAIGWSEKPKNYTYF